MVCSKSIHSHGLLIYGISVAGIKSKLNNAYSCASINARTSLAMKVGMTKNSISICKWWNKVHAAKVLDAWKTIIDRAAIEDSKTAEVAIGAVASTSA